MHDCVSKTKSQGGRRLFLSKNKFKKKSDEWIFQIGEPFAEQPLAVAVQEGSLLAKELSEVRQQHNISNQFLGVT
jgi:hypothetical protein